MREVGVYVCECMEEGILYVCVCVREECWRVSS